MYVWYMFDDRKKERKENKVQGCGRDIRTVKKVCGAASAPGHQSSTQGKNQDKIRLR
jgi:hypothetical protein